MRGRRQGKKEREAGVDKPQQREKRKRANRNGSRRQTETWHDDLLLWAILDVLQNAIRIRGRRWWGRRGRHWGLWCTIPSFESKQQSRRRAIQRKDNNTNQVPRSTQGGQKDRKERWGRRKWRGGCRIAVQRKDKCTNQGPTTRTDRFAQTRKQSGGESERYTKNWAESVEIRVMMEKRQASDPMKRQCRFSGPEHPWSCEW